MNEIRSRIERLESIVKQQQDTIDQQQDTIDRQQERIAELEAEESATTSVSRRTALKTGGLLALLGSGSRSVAADPSGHLGDASDPLRTVYTEQVAGGLIGDQTVDTLLGAGLSTEATGNETELRAAIADSNDNGLLAPTDSSTTGIDVENVYTNQLAGGLTSEQPIDDLLGAGLSAEETGDRTELRAAITSNDGLLEPTDSSTDGISVSEVRSDQLAGGLTGGRKIDNVLGAGLSTEDAGGGTELRAAITSNGGLLEPTNSSTNGINVAEVHANRLAGGLTGGRTIDDLLGAGLTTENVGGETELRAALMDSDGLLEPTNSSTDRIGITEVHTDQLAGGLTGDRRIDNLLGAGLSTENVGGKTELRAALMDSGGLLKPTNSSTGGIDITEVHTDQLAGGLTESQKIDSLLGSGLSTENVGNKTELRAALMDSGGLLEPTDSLTDGIDVTEVHAQTLFDSNGNSHLQLQDSGPLKLTQSLDANGNAVVDNGTTAISFDGSANTTIPTGRTLSVDGSLTQPTKVVSSDYTTSGEARIAVETSVGTVTVTLASTDAVDGRRVTIVDKDGNASTNAVTIETEGAETVHPGDVESKQITIDGGRLVLENIAGNWYTDRNAERETIGTDRLQVGSADVVTGGPLGDSGDWIPLAGYKIASSRIETTYREENTSYEDSDFERVGTPTQSAFIPLNQLTDITNVADVGLSWGGYVKGNEDTDSERVNVKMGYKFEDLPETEVSSGHTVSSHSSAIASISEYNTYSRTNMYMKTSTGTGYIEANLTQYLWVKLR